MRRLTKAKESQAQAPPPKRRGRHPSVRPKRSSKHLKPFHNPRQFGAYPRSLGGIIVRNGIRQKAFKFLDVVVKAGHNLICTKPSESQPKTQTSSGCQPHPIPDIPQSAIRKARPFFAQRRGAIGFNFPSSVPLTHFDMKRSLTHTRLFLLTS